MPKKGKSSRWRRNESQVLGSSDEESIDKIKEIQIAIEDSKDQVGKAIEKTLARGDKLADLEDKAEDMQHEASLFNRNARDVQRRMCWQNCKAQLILITIIVIVVLMIYFVFIHPLIVNKK